MQNFSKINYAQLSAKQKEIYNFQKIASVLADYGFNCIKLADDWLGADFLAYHKDGTDTLKVQLKARVTISRLYQGKGLHIAFPLQDGWCVIDHDELVRIVGAHTNWLNTESWISHGLYHSGTPSRNLVDLLSPYTLRADESTYRDENELP